MTPCVRVCVCVFVCACEVRSVAVLSNGRECSPPPHLIESAGLRPRLFQPQLIECICTRLHNDRWVSPQLAFFFFFLWLVKMANAGLCFSLILQSFFFSLCLSCSPFFFAKIGEGEKNKNIGECLSVVVGCFYSTWEEKEEEEREDSVG